MQKKSIDRATRTEHWVVLVLLAAIVLLSPGFEMFDKWDGFPNPDKDIVLNVLAVTVCLAASVSFALLLLQSFFAGVFAGAPPAAHFAKVTSPYQPELIPTPLLCQALRI